MADIREIAEALNKKFKKDIVQVGTKIEKRVMIPFSSPMMNYMTRGGVAKGKVSEFFGAEGSGKTTTALDAIANYQKVYPEDYVLYLDAENTLDEEWGTRLGVNWEMVILIKPEQEYAETLLEMVLDAIRTGQVGLVVIDSIPFLHPKQATEGTLEDKTYAGNSAVMTQFATKVVPACNKFGTTLIGINQLRDKIGSTYVAYNTPGGRMWKHACSQRFMFSKGKLLDHNNKEQANNFENPSAHTVNVKYEKNKVTKNDRRFTGYTLNYAEGIDVLNDTIELGLFLEVIRQGGAWYYVNDSEGNEVKFQGMAKFLEWLRNDSEQFDSLHERVLEVAVA